MADEELQIEGGKKKGKMMIIIIAVVVLLLGGGGAAYYFLFMGEPSLEAVEEVEEVEDLSGKAMYVAMPRPFIFNAPGVARERLVQIEVQLMVRGPENEQRARTHIPMIEGAILEVFSTANADALVTDIGKAALREKATAKARVVMTELEKLPVVEEVLFTGFVIQ